MGASDWIMGTALVLATAGIAADHIAHAPEAPAAAEAATDASAPCSAAPCGAQPTGDGEPGSPDAVSGTAPATSDSGSDSKDLDELTGTRPE